MNGLFLLNSFLITPFAIDRLCNEEHSRPIVQL
jgi:hypothetical protein